MIRIFDAKPVSPRFEGLGKMVGLNLAVASVSAVLGFWFFCADFAAGDSGQPTPPSVTVFLWTVVAGIAALGFWGGWRWARFPWPAVVLTPLFSGALFSLFGDRAAGLSIGAMASAALMFGALSARALRQFKFRRSAR
jgi:hypothetical protein